MMMGIGTPSSHKSIPLPIIATSSLFHGAVNARPQRSFPLTRVKITVLRVSNKAAQAASLSSSRTRASPMTLVLTRALPGAMISAVRIPPASTLLQAFSMRAASSSMSNE